MKKNPTTVRLPKAGAEALLKLEDKYPDIKRSALLESILTKAMEAIDPSPISDQECSHANYLCGYLRSIVDDHTIGRNQNDPGAGEKSLAAAYTAVMIQRVLSGERPNQTKN